MASKRMKLKHERFPIPRRCFNQKGPQIELLSNHFQVTVSPPSDGYFYIYLVTIINEDGVTVESEVMRRDILDRVAEICKLELDCAYDGERNIFTVAPLFEHDLRQFDAVVDHVRGSPFTYNVSITYHRKIPMKFIDTGDGEPPEQIRVLETILRQNAVTKGYFVISQSWFPNEPRNLNRGIAGYCGHLSSFRATQGGLMLNIDASTALIISAGPIRQFLLLNQGVTSAAEIDWFKAKGTLKNLRIKATHSNMEYTISGLSDLRCSEQTFLFKQKTGTGETEEVEMTVYDYFVCHRNIQLHESGDFPCIDVGKQNHPIYIPIELCSLVPLQHCTESLSNDHERSELLNSMPLLGPKQMMDSLKQALLSSNYGTNPLLMSCGVSISTEFTRTMGRVLTPPKLMVSRKKWIKSHSGKWNISKLLCAKKLERWAAVNFSFPCDMKKLCQDLVRCGETIGYSIDDPLQMFEEKSEDVVKSAMMRVDEMIERVLTELGEVPKFLLCILPEKKNCHLYGQLMRKTLCEVGVTTQCVAATCASQATTEYMINVLLKINAKLHGQNWALRCEIPALMPPLRIYEVPTLIIGMSVCHAPHKPSVAAAVGSFGWPLLSKYVATMRSQPPNSEIIESLFEKVSDTEDHGMFGKLLNVFYRITPKTLPDRIIIFRDGVSESQFHQVLNVELKQIIDCCKFVSQTWSPKFMVVVAQKRHHTRFFRSQNLYKNVQPGTVVDTGVCHPRNNDFYLCAHAGTMGTSRPTHYHVLCDEIGCSAAEIQEFVHALSFVYQSSTKATSTVAPILYAHRAAAQISQMIETGQDPTQVAPVPDRHGNVINSTPSVPISVPHFMLGTQIKKVDKVKM